MAHPENPKSKVLNCVLLTLGLFLVTWFFFGPIAGFHHNYGFGITFYLVLNGEDPQPADHMWGDFAVRFFWGRFIVGAVLWMISTFILFKLVRMFAKRNPANESI